MSPICEFGILTARARSTENAAIAKSSVPLRGGKTGHSCKAQQDKSVELTDCGLSGLMHVRRMLTQHLLAFAAEEFRRRSDFHQTGHWIGQKWLKSKLTIRCGLREP
jgi:hypothetical protein